MNLKSKLALLIAFLTLLPLSLKAQTASTVQVWLTTVDRSMLFARQAAPLPYAGPKPQGIVIDVNDKQRFQPIDGFGVALTGGSAELLMRMAPERRTALLRDLFATEDSAIGISYLRVSIGSSDMNSRVYSYDDLAGGATDADLARFSLDPDRADVIPALKEILAINPRIQILGSPWSAPAWMKSNDNAKGGSLKPEYYDAYAKYFVKYVEGMKAEGIPIAAITVQNEPLNPKNTPSMVMFAKEQDEFIKSHLGPAFEKAGIKTKILLYDHNPDVPSYPLSILKDPEAGKYIAGTAFHLYGGPSSVLTEVHDAFPNKELYFTEQSVTEPKDATTIDIAEPVGRVLIGATRNWSRNVLLWNLAADPNNGPHTNDGGCTECRGAITLDGSEVTRNVAYYAVAHFSKFVRPGSVRIGSNDPEQLPNAAFLTPDGKMVLVVSNTSNFPKTFDIRFRGKAVTASLPSESVGTYTW
jgi:glucosylceramidase